MSLINAFEWTHVTNISLFGYIERGSDRPIIEKGPLDWGSNRPIDQGSVWQTEGPIDWESDRPMIKKHRNSI